jgi:hypothetical protein
VPYGGGTSFRLQRNNYFKLNALLDDLNIQRRGIMASKNFGNSIGHGGSRPITSASQFYNRGTCNPAGDGYKPSKSYGNGKPIPEKGASKPGPLFGGGKISK